MEPDCWNRSIKKSNTIIGLADLNYEMKTLGEAECESLKNPSISTRQTVVVVETAGYEMFLSRRALIKLDVLPAGFPNHTIKETAASTSARTCGCPTRETALPPPEWPATGMQSREQLEKILVDHYKSSTFNICEHQQLPAISGTPLWVQLKEGVTSPTAAN